MTEAKERITDAISTLHNTFPQWEDKAIITQAWKDAEVTKDDFEDGFCPYPIISRIRFIRGLEKAIYTNDFRDTPTSIRITQAVNENLPKLKSDFPNTDQLDVLKMAYDMARGVLDNSDFETVEEEAIYFEIFIDDPMVFEEELRRQYIETLTADDFTDDGHKATFLDLKIAMGENRGRRLGKLMKSTDIIDIMISKGFSLESITTVMSNAFFNNKIDLQPGSGKGVKIDGRTLAWIGTLDFTDDNLYKIEMMKLSKIKMSHPLTEKDLEPEKYKIFSKVAEEDIKNIPPIFIDQNYKIWDGHHRYLTLKLKNFELIPVIQLHESILKQIESYSELLKGWNIEKNSNENVTQFDTELNQYLKKLGIISDFTDDKAQAQFFAKDKPVSGSSNVAEIGYERGKLRIFFKNGGGYEYPVPSSWYMEMLNAPSKGSFVWETLRGKTPGRVIDNPNKITPGGVGGSIVPYFKIKGAAMAPDAMRKSVRGFLKAARRGKAEVGGQPIRRISKPKFKEFKRFLKKGAGRFGDETQKTSKKPSTRKSQAPRKFKKIIKKILSKKGKSKTEKEPDQATDNSAVREKIKRIKKALQNARKNKLDEVIINALENRIKTLEKSISDFINFTNSLTFYNITDDFTDDMKHFAGPITRAGEFQYHNETKIKDYNNLTEVFNDISHLPSFDSHNEDQILGFAYNFKGDPDTEQIFSEGYTFNDIEETADVLLDSNTKLPVSIRFLDANEGTENPEQNITNLIHLAISVNQTDTDRCSSAGGNPCYVQFQDRQDFIENTKLEQKPVGDLMPKDMDKEKKEKEKKPPKDMDEEEEEEDMNKKKKKTSDMPKDDPPMDAEYQSEAKNTKDFDSNFMKVSKEQWEDINKLVSDMATREKKRIEVVSEIELSKIKSDFTDKEQLYKLSSDFVNSASLSDMQTVKTALVEHNPDVDAQKQLFTSDMGSDIENIKNKMKKMYGVDQ